MKRVLSMIAVAALVACDDTHTSPFAGGTINFVNSVITIDQVSVHVDGHFGSTVGSGNVHVENVAYGAHTVEVRRNGVIEFSQSNVFPGSSLVVWDSSGLLRPSMLLDTGAIVPAGKSKLRVVHFAQAAGAIDIWRTQPDFQTPIRIMFPFNYRDESPYLQSDPGNWRVMASTAVANPGDPMPDTLASSGLINVPDGRSRTVVLVKSESGQLQFVVLEP